MSRPRSERPSFPKVLSHLGVMVAVAAVLGVVVAGLAIPFAAVVGVTTRSVADTMDQLPTELETDALPQKTRIVDGKGETIATIFDQNRVNVSLDQISRTMVKAIVAIEDYRFYEHGALDVRGTVRALLTNSAASGVVQGGSSITQQMVKLTLLQQADTKKEQREAVDQTYARKLRELRYAIAVEQRYSKDWILERYLNIAYFGDGAYGVQAAARHYFDVNARKLNLNQSAILAGLVQNPTAFDPTNAPDRARERRDIVLDRMAQLNVVTDKMAEKTKNRGLRLDVNEVKNGCVFSRAPFFCDYVLNYLMKDRSLGRTEEERKRLIYSGGLTIRTTVDLRYQDAADESVRNNVYKDDEAIGALAMVEPRTGEVKAIAQSRPMGAKKRQGETYLNYVVPSQYGDSNGFQAGSTFKAFVLASALQQGIPLSQSIASPSQVFLDQGDFEVCDGEFYQSSEIWDPSNSTDSGTFDLYTGTRLSVNTFFAQLEQMTGLCEPFELAKSMGVQLTEPATEMVPTFTLGVADVSPLEMAEAYATFAGRGLHCDSRPVTAILDANGNTLKDYPARCTQVMPSSVADAVNDVLRGVQEPGGFGYSAGINTVQPSAGKTGTIQENRAVWFAGYTPNLATAAMIAGANIEGQPITLNGQTIGNSFVSAAFGSTLAGPMWGDAMKVIEQYLDDEDFVAPNGSDVLGVLTGVPDVAGQDIDSARATLEELGFTVSLGGYVPSGYSVDTVAYTGPGAGTELASGDTVVIYQSTGREPRPPGGNGGGDGGNGNGNGGRGNNGNGNGGRG
ncbi:carboxypeptidase [Nocardioides psychrotolerans]|uniref:Membrane carboxypeptidase (Penicillin-binding protein) n=1 Tax=Nocardioides psychrotolerans TaxID=1005945 RepID=A0A1I3DXH3_9ACTN|nr:transglycosylase domain-containing protein [Nocardioides psychrotolerans]GEP39280.1 carboxypeptidase [Nocardioides psychrotolerans]SFH91385.1 Membrane carboxypeptidase (penicillin-binding protein) [Nocardioides psychrotolerans]